MRGAIRADSTGMKSDGKVRGVAGLGVGNSTDGDVTGNAKTKEDRSFRFRWCVTRFHPGVRRTVRSSNNYVIQRGV